MSGGAGGGSSGGVGDQGRHRSGERKETGRDQENMREGFDVSIAAFKCAWD